jgi:hypothetical protein
MKLKYEDAKITAYCPDCGSLSSFEAIHHGSFYGRVERTVQTEYDGVVYLKTTYLLLRCANCGRGGFATIAGSATGEGGPPPRVVGFSPLTVQPAPVPEAAPADIRAELREAERCAAVGGWRAASALLRSALEKTLKANGYTKGSLADKIDEAASDGVITSARKQRAHDEVRVLGNDVLHDAWRPVDETEYDLAHLYTQRVVEDFYDHRVEVEAVLKKNGRL